MLAKNTRLKLIFMKKNGLQKKRSGKKYKAINDGFVEKYKAVFPHRPPAGSEKQRFWPFAGVFLTQKH